MKKRHSIRIVILILNFVISNALFAQLAPVMNPIQGPSHVCSQPGDPPTYTASASNSPTSYNWTYYGPSAGVIISNPSGSVTSISFPFPNLYTTYMLYCSATNSSGTSSTVYFVVDVYETPTVTFSGSHIFCQGSSTNLSASPTILSSSSTLFYNWSPSTGLNSTTGPTVNAQPPSTTNYTVLLTLGNSIGSCTNTAQLTVFVAICEGLGENIKAETGFLSLYPNPNNGVFVLLSSKDELAVILNEIGQTVRSFSLLAGSETKITGLSAGIYFIMTPTSRKKIVVTD